MANRSDADEDDHLDLTLAIHHLSDYFAADGVVTDDETAILDAICRPHTRLTTRYRTRRAVETLLNCGTSRHACTVAADAGITIITDATGAVIDARMTV